MTGHPKRCDDYKKECRVFKALICTKASLGILICSAILFIALAMDNASASNRIVA